MATSNSNAGAGSGSSLKATAAKTAAKKASPRKSRPRTPQSAGDARAKMPKLKDQRDRGPTSDSPVSGSTEGPRRTYTVRLPLVTASITRPARVVATPKTDAGLARPPMRRLAVYGTTAALGALGVIEWPVALLVAGGAYLTGRARQDVDGNSRMQDDEQVG